MWSSRRIHSRKLSSAFWVGAALALAAPVAQAGTKSCLAGTDPSAANDLAQVQAVRGLIDAACVCSSFDGSSGKTHGNYLTCAKTILGTAISNASLRKQCKGSVSKFYKKSACGLNPSLHRQPCIRTTSAGKITCTIKSATKADGVTPSGQCTNGKSFTQVACPSHTTCIDAADTDHNLIIAAPGDSGGCVGPAAPTFPGLVLVVPTDIDSVQLAWLSASDDTTPENSIRYDIYLSEDPGFVPSASNIFASVTGQIQATLTGLAPGTVYYVLVIAIDQERNSSVERDMHSFTTPDFPVQRSTVTALELSEQLNLGMPVQRDSASLTFANQVGASLPTIGSILIGPTADGEGYIRKVENVSQSADSIIVSTSPVALADAVDDMPLTSEVRLFDVAQVSQGVAATPLHAQARQLASSSQMNGSVSSMEWSDHLLTAEEIDHAATENGLAVVSQPPGHFELASVTGAAERAAETITTSGFTASIDLSFEPSLITDAKWTLLGGIQSGRIIAHGTLNLDINANYMFNGASSFQLGPVELSRRTYKALYIIGGIPVYQVTSLALKAQVSGEASSAINSSAHATAGAAVEAGIVYDPSTGSWEPDQSLNVSSDITAALSVVGGVQAQVRLIPEITVKFYNAVVGILSVEPYEDGSLTAEGTLDALCAPLELDSADLKLGVECFAKADLSILHHNYTLIDRTKICGPYTFPLFTLPEATLTATDAGGHVDLIAGVTDGVHDKFDASSVQWSVNPPDAGVLAVDSSSPLRATFTCSQAEPVMITFSGNGTLGPISRHCDQIEVQCVTPTATTAPASTSTPIQPPTPTDTPPATTITPTPASGTNIGILGGTYSEATAFSNGQVVGYADTAAGHGPQHAFSWTQAGGMLDLGTLGGYSAALAVSNGQAVGGSVDAGNHEHAFSWTQAGGMVDLGTLGGFDSEATAVNNGQVVGISSTSTSMGYPHAFSWTQAGGMVDLGTLGGFTSRATAVENGQVVGYAQSAQVPNGCTGNGFTFVTSAFSWTQAGGMVDLGTLGGYDTRAVAVSNGQVVGHSIVCIDNKQFTHAVSWTEGGGVVDLGTLNGGSFSEATAVSNGQVVGYANTAGNGSYHAFTWTQAGGMVDLGTLGGATSRATAVDNGQVVGYASTASGATHAFSWTQATGMIDLGTLGGTYSEAVAVEIGQVVGNTTIASGYFRAVLWTP